MTRSQPFASGTIGPRALGGRAVRGGAISVAAQALQVLAVGAGTVVLARLLTPADYGVFAMASVVTGLAALVKDLGLGEATVQRASVSHAQASTLFWITLALGALTMLVVAGAAPIVAWFFGVPVLASVTVVLSTAFPMAALTAQHAALLRRDMRFGALASSELVAVVVGVVTTVLLAWRGARHWALVGGRLVEAATLAATVWGVSGWRPGRPVRDASVRSMVGFGARLTGFSLLNYAARNVDTLLIGRVWGAEALGVYARAYQLLLLPIRQVNTPVAAVAVPVLSRLAGDPARYRVAYLRLLETITLATMPAAALAMVTADWIVAVALGPRWTAAAPVFAILALSAVVQPMANTVGWLFLSQGRTGDLLRWGMIGSTVIIGGILIGLPWGVRGVATSYAITFVTVAVPLLFWCVGRTGPVRAGDAFRAAMPAALASAAVLVVVAALRALVGDVTAGRGLALAVVGGALAVVAALRSAPVGRASIRHARDTARLLWSSGRDDGTASGRPPEGPTP